MSPGDSSPGIPNEADRTGAAAPARPARRRREIRWTPILISIASVIVVFGTIAYFVGRSEQWPRIRRQFFNWDAMVESFPDVLRGFWLNLEIWVICIVSIGTWALVLTLFRVLRGPLFAPLRVFAIVYVDLFRGIPALLLVVLFAFGIPALRIPSLPSSALFWGIVAMTLSYAAYATEVFRAEYGFGGIFTVDLGTSARALRFMELLQNADRFGYMAVSLGYFDTLMSCSASSTSSEMSDDALRRAGISPGLVRLSIGYTGSVDQRWNQMEDALKALDGSSGITA